MKRGSEFIFYVLLIHLYKDCRKEHKNRTLSLSEPLCASETGWLARQKDAVGASPQSESARPCCLKSGAAW